MHAIMCENKYFSTVTVLAFMHTCNSKCACTARVPARACLSKPIYLLIYV